MEKFFPPANDESFELDNNQKIFTIINAASFLAQSGLAQRAGPAVPRRIEKLMQNVSVWVRQNGGVPQDNSAVLQSMEALEKMFQSLGPQIVKKAH